MQKSLEADGRGPKLAGKVEPPGAFGVEGQMAWC